MERVWLAEQLSAGRSIEAIAREVGKNPSTVAYWMNKHGLVSAHAERHAARGGVEEERLRELVERGVSVRQIAAELELSATAVRYWLRRYGLSTAPARQPRADDGADALVRECATHGWVVHVRGGDGYVRCRACRSSRVIERRRKVKATLVAEAGGACVLCGYDRSPAALQFHHVDPGRKAFSLSRDGRVIALDRLREEAAKCALLCANCHAEVESGVARLPFDGTSEASPG